MEPQDIPPMPPHLSGPVQSIPIRTSSKRALQDLPTRELEDKRSELNGLIKRRRNNLKPSSSHDSEYWSSHVQVLEMEKQLHEYNSIMKFREYPETEGSNSTLTYDQWLKSVDMGLESGRRQKAIELKLAAADSQASRLAQHSPFRESWIKLFFGEPSGFGLANATRGKRDSGAQSKMRKEMLQKYHEKDKLKEMAGLVWDPVCADWFFAETVHAAHLYPWKSVEHMDVIFGDGAKDEILTAANGLFLLGDLEDALDRGYLGIVPDVHFEPDNQLDPTVDMHIRREYVKSWEQTDPKEYKIIVLDNDPFLKKKLHRIFVKPHSNIKSIEELHGRRLRFRTNFRPRARYMWWMYLNSVLNLSYRHHKEDAKSKGRRKSKDAETDVAKGIDREVELANRYWGTRGRYVKRNQLLGLVEHIGHDIASIKSSPSTILENAIEEEAGEGNEPDASLVAVLADATIRRASENIMKDELGSDSEQETDDDSEQETGDDSEQETDDEES
ncbi:hypothetical protein F4818DRAFT_438873 [Hypoxylon cercidicola]|nr:hypothetical protein F4818DRAFT_438873 [Hypoxylon cercidicola]